MKDVLVQTYEDAFGLPRTKYDEPAKLCNILTKGDPDSIVDIKAQSYQMLGWKDDTHDAVVTDRKFQRVT